MDTPTRPAHRPPRLPPPPPSPPPETWPSGLTTLRARIAGPTAALRAHPVYAAAGDVAFLRHFMAHHVFAVWDFMSLLKTLQVRLTGVSVPWTPPADPVAARLINEIVLAEETDDVIPGEPLSHYALYLEAMEAVGADARPVQRLVRAIQRGASVNEALAEADAPPPAADFVRATLATCEGPTESVAAAFLFGREALVPEMFTEVRAVVPSGGSRDTLRLYLERHIELDGDTHGPQAEALLCRLCGVERARWRAAETAATEALAARQLLWDAVWATRPR